MTSVWFLSQMFIDKWRKSVRGFISDKCYEEARLHFKLQPGSYTHGFILSHTRAELYWYLIPFSSGHLILEVCAFANRPATVSSKQHNQHATLTKGDSHSQSVSRLFVSKSIIRAENKKCHRTHLPGRTFNNPRASKSAGRHNLYSSKASVGRFF